MSRRDAWDLLYWYLATCLGFAVIENDSGSVGLLLCHHVHNIRIRWINAVSTTIQKRVKTGADILRNGLNILPSYTEYFRLTPAITGLQTSSIFVGGCLAGLIWGSVTEHFGRRLGLLYATLITMFAVMLQTASQNTAMFVIARMLIGFGTAASGCAGPAFLAETLPLQARGYGIGLLNDCYYVGTYTLLPH